MEATEALAAKFGVLLPHLDEWQRRLLAGARARALGGGIEAVTRASGMRRATAVPCLLLLGSSRLRWLRRTTGPLVSWPLDPLRLIDDPQQWPESVTEGSRS